MVMNQISPYKKVISYLYMLIKDCQPSHKETGQGCNIAYGGREYLIDIYEGLCKALWRDFLQILDLNVKVTLSIVMQV